MDSHEDKKSGRRKFLKMGAGALALGTLPLPFIKRFSSGGRLPSSRDNKNPLNVIFMTADDIGWKDLSCDGNENIKTPHLDALAAQGIRFERAFGVSSSCSSSRASFITGQYVSTHGVDGLTHRYPTRQLPPGHPTMARYFKNVGYRTAIEGKWHVAVFLPVGLYGYEDNIGSSLLWKRHIEDTKNIDHYFRDRSKDGKPFYLELNFTDTHRNAEGKFKTDPDFVVDPNTIRVPEYMGLPDWPEIRADLALYYGKVLRNDYLIGKTLESLKKHGLEENTVVVFVSDNGSPFPGNKMSLLDRGIATPLIMRVPGKIAPNRVSQAMVSTIDIMPTLLQLCEVPYGKDVDGKSFSSLLVDVGSDHHRDHVFAEVNCHVKPIPMKAVRTERWKAIQNLTDAPLGLDDLEGVEWASRLCERQDQPWLRPRPPFELYDLENDPHETTNLAGKPEFAEIEKTLRNYLVTQFPTITGKKGT